MSETPTERVELTDAERESLLRIQSLAGYPTAAAQVFAAVESIVAARVQALTAERDGLAEKVRVMKAGIPASHETVAVLRAEKRQAIGERNALAARCAELGEKLDRLSTEIMDQNAEKWGDQPLTDDEKALLLRFNALSVVLDKSEAENAALQATLDRVTALADEWDGSDGIEIALGGADYVVSGLRAALTPEGTE